MAVRRSFATTCAISLLRFIRNSINVQLQALEGSLIAQARFSKLPASSPSARQCRTVSDLADDQTNDRPRPARCAGQPARDRRLRAGLSPSTGAAASLRCRTGALFAPPHYHGSGMCIAHDAGRGAPARRLGHGQSQPGLRPGAPARACRPARCLESVFSRTGPRLGAGGSRQASAAPIRPGARGRSAGCVFQQAGQ